MLTTAGQVIINNSLPESLRDYDRVVDKKSIQAVLEDLATNYPDKYRDVVHKLYLFGADAAYTAGASFSPEDLIPPEDIRDKMGAIRSKARLIAEQDIPDEEKKEQLQDLLISAIKPIESRLLEEGKAGRNRLAMQAASGSRGGPGDLRSMIVGDFLVADHKDNVIPVPILHGYAEGLGPAEYWAGSYGARKGTISTKFATQKSGFFGKQLTQAAHRQVVTSKDCDTERGIPVDADDPDNAGTVLAVPFEKGNISFAAGTVLTPDIMKQLKGQEVTIRSPLTCSARHGLCSKCVGIRDTGKFPEIGENVGVQAATSLTEPVSQGALSEKHGGGRATGQEGRLRGFELVNQLVQVPDNFKEAATLSSVDGVVSGIKPAPQGGVYVIIDGDEHYVSNPDMVSVSVGDHLERGDPISKGIPNPAEIVAHRGIGEGRYRFMQLYKKAYEDSGWRANRRNVEILARGLINNVRVTDVDGVDGALPDDIAEYDALERKYHPRYGALSKKPSAAVGTYLEQPVSYYSIGTRITPSIARRLDKNGIKEIMVHRDEPSFQPEMVRVMESLSHAPDWQLRFGGSYLKRGLTEAVERGRSSEIHQTSYIPSIARGADFGRELSTKGIY